MKKHKQNNDQHAHSALEASPSHLLHRVLQIALDIYSVSAGEGALTQRQYAVLKALDEAKSPDGTTGITQTDLVQATGIDRSTLADMVTRMTTKGLLVREKSTSDGRANLVSLSPAGITALQETLPKVGVADAAILDLLSPPKRDSFVKLLRKLTQAREAQILAVEASEAAQKSEKLGKKAGGKKVGAKTDESKASAAEAPPKKPKKTAEKKKKVKKPEKAVKRPKAEAAAKG